MAGAVSDTASSQLGLAGRVSNLRCLLPRAEGNSSRQELVAE
jgi:hypothetical protein